MIKYILGLLTVITLRMLPHPPNVEPIMATMMPFSKKFGAIYGFVFCLTSIIFYDIITGTLGDWSFITASTYAFIGLFAGIYLKNKKGTRYYVLYAVISTLVYDFVTGVCMGTFMFGQPFIATLILQIPFTISHLWGNIVLSMAISPMVYKFIVKNPKLKLKHDLVVVF